MLTVSEMENFKDERFSHIQKDARFRCMPKKERKVKIDKRFKGMFNDGKFKLKYQVDKRGRPVHASTSENLKKYYDLSSGESSETDSDDEEENVKGKSKKAQNNKAKSSSDEKDSDSRSSSEEIESGVNKQNKSHKKSPKEFENIDTLQDHKKPDVESSSDKSDDSDSSDNDSDSGLDIDYSRGVHLMESSSSSEESDSEDELNQNSEDKFDHKWGEMDKDAERTEEITNRLALCNMNWDRLKAHDIMAILNSFKPSGGSIKSVHIYPSEYGLERMKAEECQGPTELVSTKADNISTEKASEGSSYHREKLREYQLNRLKYYYAVVECDKASTANAIYEECDGMEYESTGTKIDLRFIPDGMTFDQKPTSTVSDVPDTTTYKPSSFVTSALQQSAVECTWDETDHNRVALTMRKFNKDDLEEMDLKDYLASDSDIEEENPYGNVDIDAAIVGSESEDEETQIEKYRRLMQSLSGDNKDEKVENNDMEMEITWEPGLRETTEKIVEKQQKEKTSTPWEQYLEKKKDKKKKKRQENRKKDTQMNEVEDDDKVAISDDDIPSDVDMNDPYFKEELEKMQKPSKNSEEKKTKKTKKKYKKNKLTPEELKEKEEREAELKLLLMDEEDNKQHFNLKQLMEADNKTKKKKKAKYAKKNEEENVLQDNFELDMGDSRFNVLFENPHYNIDPSAPEFKKTKAMEQLINEKIKRSKTKSTKKEKQFTNSDATKIGLDSKTLKRKNAVIADDEVDSATVKASKSNGDNKQSRDIELTSLIKSVKAKTQMAKSKKKLK